jgi:hypothetical protein
LIVGTVMLMVFVIVMVVMMVIIMARKTVTSAKLTMTTTPNLHKYTHTHIHTHIYTHTTSARLTMTATTTTPITRPGGAIPPLPLLQIAPYSNGKLEIFATCRSLARFCMCSGTLDSGGRAGYGIALYMYA